MVESSANITVAPLSLLTGQLQPIWLDPTIRFRRQGHGGLGLGILTASLTFCRCAPAAGTSLCVCEAGLRSHRLRGLPDHRDRRSRKLTCAYWLADSWLRMPAARRDCCSVGAAVVGLSAGAVATCHRDRGKYQSATLTGNWNLLGHAQRAQTPRQRHTVGLLRIRRGGQRDNRYIDSDSENPARILG